MNLEQLLDAVPNYAKDLKLNLGNLLAQPELSKQQIWGTALTSAITARNPQLLKAIEAKAAEHLTHEALRGHRLDITSHHHADPIGRVVVAIEIPQALGREGPQRVRQPDRQPFGVSRRAVHRTIGHRLKA